MAKEQAEISQGRKLSGIWVIPLLALVLGIYMVIHTWMTEGPTITIAFNTAEGLAQGKTAVKYRNVDMGVVEEVILSDDLKSVMARVKMERQALPLLRDDTRFWLVTAKVGLGQVSGLGTLLSGAYIELSPGTGKQQQRDFTALEHAPMTPTGAPGLRLQLTSDRATSVNAGDKVLYKGYTVGRVESRELDSQKRTVSYTVFIDAPYHEFVDSSVRFWNVSGISLSAGAGGFKVETGSMETILLGGVAFDSLPGVSQGEAVANETEFKLYSSYDETLQNPYRYGTYYVVSFGQSIKGLVPGAPVEYRGIPIGRVERIMLKESLEHNRENITASRGKPIQVLIYLEPGRLAVPDSAESVDYLKKTINEGIATGLRAVLESGNLLTGGKYIGMDYFENAEPATPGSFMDYSTIPTISGGLQQMEQKLTAVLDKINGLPLEDTVAGANAAIASLQGTLDSLKTIMESQNTQQLPAQLDATLSELRVAISGLTPGSELYRSMNSSMLRLNRTLSNLESMSRSLAEKPNSAIMPSAPVRDPVPEIKQ